MKGGRPTVKDELDACWATGRRWGHKGKVLFTPWEQVLPGTCSPLLPGFSAHMCQPFSEAAPIRTAPALGTASFLALGSEQLTGAGRVPVVGWPLPGTCTHWNWLVLHKLLAQMSGGNNLLTPVNLPLPCLCPHSRNRRQPRESHGRARAKIILHASVFVD